MSSVHTQSFFGYSTSELGGRPLVNLAHPGEQSALMNAVQVLLRMGQIMHLTGCVSGNPQEMRLIHRVILGLGQPDRQPNSVTLDSVLTLIEGEPGVIICRSRRATGPEAPFQMLPVPSA